MGAEPGTPSVIKNMNRRTVLDTIENGAPISRADIARITGLSAPTVSAVVKYLLKRGLVREVGPGKSRGGRKPGMLQSNPSAAYVLGVDLGSRELTVALADLGGRIIQRVSGPAVSKELGSHIAESLRSLARELILEAGIDPRRVMGMGVAAPGVTDPETGVVSLAPALGWENIRLRDMLFREFGVPICVENDVNAAALAEKLFGHGKGLDSFVVVFVGSGLGAGIVVNGELYRGHMNLAGEIGYMVVDPSWTQEHGAGFGCLESLTSESVIIDRATVELGMALPETGSDPLRIERLFYLASSGNEAARKLLTEVARYLSIGLANLFWVLSPTAIILGGMVAKDNGEVLVALIREHLSRISPRTPELYISEIGKEAGILGAISISLKEVKMRLLDETFTPQLAIGAD
ncbi:MAG: ROK family transcriptional regulator [Bacillota bacterium]